MAAAKKNKDKPPAKIRGSSENPKDNLKNNKNRDKRERTEGFAELLEYTRKRTLIR
jgi:hypothetical protein